MNYLYWQEISSFLHDLDKERQVFEKSAMTSESMENTRAKMMNLFEVLKSSLEQRMDKYHASLILFPMVAATDEKMQSYDYNSTKVKWAPLQKDFYAAYTAGEIFFKTLDEILDEPNIPNIVYQVFYAMLKRGFQGKYKDSKTQINKYLEMLKDKIPVEYTHDKKITRAPPPVKSRVTRFKRWHWYSLSVVLAVATFGVLTLIAHIP